MAILGVDVGGTFTDAVLVADGSVTTAKVPTAARQEESVLAAARAVGADRVEHFAHGTTVATNTLLERKGARTAFVTTAGFEHLLHVRRQNRHLYRLCDDHPEPLVPLDRSFGVREADRPRGVLEPLDLASLPDFGADVEAIAVCLLFAFRDSSHERAVADELRRRLRRPRRRLARGGARVPRYERASTTAVDAYLGPVVSRYLTALGAGALAAGLPAPLVMRSSGRASPHDRRGRRASGVGTRLGPGCRSRRRARRAAREHRERDLARHGRDLDGRLSHCRR